MLVEKQRNSSLSAPVIKFRRSAGQDNLSKTRRSACPRYKNDWEIHPGYSAGTALTQQCTSPRHPATELLSETYIYARQQRVRKRKERQQRISALRNAGLGG